MPYSLLIPVYSLQQSIPGNHLESLDKPILDSEGNLTTLGELIADDKALELDGWVSDSVIVRNTSH